MTNLSEILGHIDPVYLPKAGTKSFVILRLLVDGQRHPTHEIEQFIAANPYPGMKSVSIRSGLQSLGNSTHRYWNIRNHAQTGEGIYQLDHRHLTGRPEDDVRARADRERLLLTESLAQAQREAIRINTALARHQAFYAKQDEF